MTDAVKDRSSEFKELQFFICGDEKDLDGRVVVLRKADQQNNFIQYHSDIRSSKIEKNKKKILIVRYCFMVKEKIQLRIKAVCAEINYDNDVTKESWDKNRSYK